MVPEQPARCWAPLSTTLGVSGLPKGALVELQPLACIPEVCGMRSGCTYLSNVAPLDMQVRPEHTFCAPLTAGTPCQAWKGWQ